MRRLATTTTRVSALSAASVGSARHVWDGNGHQPESLFMDRKDLYQMYPAKKPRVGAGEYGYQRATYWNIFLSPNPAIRLPHERRRLNPKPAKVVTVYGASGFLGCAIARQLLEDPLIEKVRVTTRYPLQIPAGSELEKLLEEGGEKIELHECDVTDRIQVNVAANGADALIFAVDFHSEFSDNSHHDVFVTGAINIAWTARCVRAERVIFCSGMDSTFASESNYVDMRCRAEDACAGNFPDCTILRFGPLFGNNYRYRGLGKYVYPTVFPDTKVQPIWVVDAARAVVRCTRANRAIRYKFDLGGPLTMSHLDFAQKFSKYFQPRLIFPFPKAVALLFARIAPWVCPNPWFDDNWLLTYELDQVPRPSGMFDRLAGWERLEYTPHTIEQAAAISKGEAELPDWATLEAKYAELEKRDTDAFREEEEEAKKRGVHRGKAEPAHGRGEGMELLAQEIYPGQQFRVRPLADAKYPDTVKNPGPMSVW